MLSIIETSAVKSDPPFQIVGIGASAGGLRALGGFFSAMPANPAWLSSSLPISRRIGKAFSSKFLPAMPRCRSKSPSMGKRSRPNKVYVMPPNATLTIADGRLRAGGGSA